MPEAIQASELALNFRARIEELHQKSAAIDERIRTALQEKLETTNAAAQMVYAAKKDLAPTEFDLATDFLSSDAISAYITLGRKFRNSAPEPANDLATSIKTVRSALMLTGAIDTPNGHGPQQYHAPNFFSQATSWVQLTAAAFQKYLNRHRLPAWHATELDSLLAALTPILRIYKTLNAEIQRRKQ
jgi:hypothetical protein